MKNGIRFTAERMVFMDEMLWMDIDGPDSIERLASEFCPHLGKDSFFDL
ncbi:MAG: hypothetical protein KKE36_10075 [Actinobacteria bacterium]|nr:hypothetical protein [Actinomycetota bacterium]